MADNNEYLIQKIILNLPDDENLLREILNILAKNQYDIENSSYWFVGKYLDKLDWYYISLNPRMNPEFFERHLDKLEWYEVSRNPGMTPEFFERHLDKLWWDEVSWNSGMTPRILRETFR